MLLCIAGPKQCGKKTLINHLESKGYKIFEFNQLLGEEIMNKKLWAENNAVILPNIESWSCFKKRPWARLYVIYAPSSSEWRSQNDNAFTQSFLKEKKYKHVNHWVSVSNFGSVPDMLVDFESYPLEMRQNLNMYYMDIAFSVSVRGNCMKLNVGVVIVKNNRIIATGYNGTPTGMLNCYEGGCHRCNSNTKNGINLTYCFCLHAEESALLNVGFERSSGADMYVTHFPCQLCFRKIVQMGIKKVFYRERYSNKDDNVIKYFEDASIETIKLN